MVFTHCHDRMHCNQKQNLFFPGFQLIQMARCQLHCRNNCMVIRHFAVIHDFLHIWLLRLIKRTGQLIFFMDLMDHISRCLFHILCQILTVRSWVSNQLQFIQALCGIQCLFSCHSVDAVGFSLQCCQIIQFRRFYFLFCLVYCRNNRFTTLASFS